MNPFMLAVEKDNVEVVKAMMKEDPGLMSLAVGSGTTVIHWALEEGHHRNAFFKVLCFCFFMFVTLNCVYINYISSLDSETSEIYRVQIESSFTLHIKTT